MIEGVEGIIDPMFDLLGNMVELGFELFGILLEKKDSEEDEELGDEA